MIYLLRDFWLRETGTGQQMAQLHERYMMMMMMMMKSHIAHSEIRKKILVMCGFKFKKF